MTIWRNGRLLPATADAIDATDRGFTLGDGLFETIRVARGEPAFFERHHARLCQGAELLGIEIPFGAAELRNAIAATCRAEGRREAAARLTLTRGPGARGLLPPAMANPTVIIAAGPLPETAPARVVIDRVTRRNELSPLARVKSLSFLDCVLARIEAARRGADDALLLNTRGQVAEASAANLFVLLDERLVTPPIEDGALPGIRRALLIERCGAEERSLAPADLLRAETGFLSTSLWLRPITAIEDHTLAAASVTLAARLSAETEQPD